MTVNYYILFLFLFSFLIVPVSATDVPEFTNTERSFDNLMFVSVLMTINDTVNEPYASDADRELAHRAAFTKNVERVATAFIVYERFDYSRSLDDVLRDRRGDCSEIAMLETAMLSVMKIRSQIVIGVLIWDTNWYPTKGYRIPFTRYAIVGHAWVETEDGIVLGNPTDNTTVWSCELVRMPGKRVKIPESVPTILNNRCRYWNLSTEFGVDL
ncbi:MAG: transglutaminase-like domain-containing protein [Methanoregula sp.]|nr:transglutaminase-like domain-containing protein [Methanoregula sp.]